MKNLIYVLMLISAGGGLCSGQIVQNGSFELGPTPPYGGLDIMAPDSTTLPDWTVSSGSIDVVGSDYWQPEDGTRSLDMDGISAGTIMQSVSGFTVGQHYRLSFYMAGNNNLSPVTFHLQASAGATTQTFTFDATGHSYTNMGWSLRTLDFAADNTTETLTFMSLDPGNAGPTLDNVSITTIPEPGTTSLLGVVAALCWRRKIRRH